MGLLSRIPSVRAGGDQPGIWLAPETVVWQPDGLGVEELPAAQAQDTCCAGRRVYATRFTTPGLPGAGILVMVYAYTPPGPPPEEYTIVWRYEHQMFPGMPCPMCKGTGVHARPRLHLCAYCGRVGTVGLGTPGPMPEPWTYSGWDCPRGPTAVYPDLPAAEDAARTLAAGFASREWSSDPSRRPVEGTHGTFDWDGAPW